MDALAVSRRRYVARLAARLLLRFHMSLIFIGTFAAAMLVSRLLMLSGVHAIMLRYALAVVGGYLVFFVLVRGWIFYVARLGPGDPGIGVPDLSGGFGGGDSGSGGGPSFRVGGGRFGGGGASGSFDNAPAVPTLADAGVGSGVGGGGGGGSSWSIGGLDLDEGIWIVIALLVLVTCLGGAAIWLVWQAPVILPDAAFEALLAAGLVKAARCGGRCASSTCCIAATDRAAPCRPLAAGIV